MPLLPAVPVPFLPRRDRPGHDRPLRAGGWVLYPETRDVRLGWHGRRFGVACRWRAPWAVTAVAPDGEVHHVRVRDPTRRWQVTLLAVAGVAAAILRMRHRAARAQDFQKPSETVETQS